MTLAEPLQITQHIAQVFERLGIRYLVSGSLASSLHGIPRATHDVDIVAEIANHHVVELVKALESTFYIDGEMIRKAIQYQQSFNLIHLATMFKVDVFILKPDAISKEEMTRRQQYQISENPQDTLFIMSAEDIIIQKLFWYQLGGEISDQQWKDVLGVLQVQYNKLDYPYLEHMAEQKNILHLLKQAIIDVQEREE